MATGDNYIEALQVGVFLLAGGYFLLLFFDAFPTDSISNGPFSNTLVLLRLMPWLLVGAGVLVLMAMVREVLE